MKTDEKLFEKLKFSIGSDIYLLTRYKLFRTTTGKLYIYMMNTLIIGICIRYTEII